MENELHVGLVQTALVWEDPEANKARLQELIAPMSQEVDLIVLPEMFTTGFTMNASEFAETIDGPSVDWMKTVARLKQAAVMGSLIIAGGGKYYNQLVFVYPNGEISYYNKRHTFTLAGEDKVFASGEERCIIDYKGWKLCPMVCYDLRFPVWARYQDDYDALIYVANWPNPRINAWDTLLQARAIENMSYCIGVNRVGVDEKGNEYCGHSATYNPLGESISEFLDNEINYRMVTLHKEEVVNTRRKFKFLNDRDAFTLG